MPIRLFFRRFDAFRFLFDCDGICSGVTWKSEYLLSTVYVVKFMLTWTYIVWHICTKQFIVQQYYLVMSYNPFPGIVKQKLVVPVWVLTG